MATTPFLKGPSRLQFFAGFYNLIVVACLGLSLLYFTQNKWLLAITFVLARIVEKLQLFNVLLVSSWKLKVPTFVLKIALNQTG